MKISGYLEALLIVLILIKLFHFAPFSRFYYFIGENLDISYQKGGN